MGSIRNGPAKGEASMNSHDGKLLGQPPALVASLSIPHSYHTLAQAVSQFCSRTQVQFREITYFLIKSRDKLAIKKC
jgi:hypothetical protein